MPVMDGISCVKQIREYENLHGLKRTPIIIQTGKVYICITFIEIDPALELSVYLCIFLSFYLACRD